MALAARGARVGMMGRDPLKGERCLEAIRAATGNASLHLFCADLASQAEVRRVAGEILEAFPRIHLLINNAGVVNLRHSETVDGIEMVFAVNHLASFLLTNLLLDRLRESAPARIVNVSSHAHKFVKGVDFADPGRRKNYAAMRVYGQSKLANLLFGHELSRRLAGSGVTVNSVHPGAVATGLGANNGSISRALIGLLGLFFNSPARGAATSLYAATSPDLEGVTGRYFARCRETSPSAAGRDDAAARRLWELSEEMIGLRAAPRPDVPARNGR